MIRRRVAYTIAGLSVAAAAIIGDPYWLGLGMCAVGVAAILWAATGADADDATLHAATSAPDLRRVPWIDGGSHEQYPHMPAALRHLDIAYCESTWRHSQEADR